MASGGGRLWRDLLLPPKLAPIINDEDEKEKRVPVEFLSPGSSSTSLSSPVNSDDRCSIQTVDSGGDGGDGEDDDYIVQLAYQTANDILQGEDDDSNAVPISSPNSPKFWGLSGSPQSTLCECEIENCETPKGLSRDESAIYDAAAKFKNMNLNEEAPANPRIHGDRSIKEREDWGKERVEAKNHELIQKPQKGWRRKHSGGSNNGRRFRSRRTPPHEGGGSGMMAIFLNGAAGARGGGGATCGTGVFLPPRIGHSSTYTRIKTGCSTALLPARVVQALKLNPDKIGPLCRPKTLNFHPQQQAWKNGLFSEEEGGEGHREMGLPQEWTY